MVVEREELGDAAADVEADDGDVGYSQGREQLPEVPGLGPDVERGSERLVGVALASRSGAMTRWRIDRSGTTLAPQV